MSIVAVGVSPATLLFLPRTYSEAKRQFVSCVRFPIRTPSFAFQPRSSSWAVALALITANGAEPK